MSDPVRLDHGALTVADLEGVARQGRTVVIGEAARAAMVRSRRLVEDTLTAGRVVYGINTGFGELSHVTIPKEDVARLQLNLVRSHSVGVGHPLAEDVVRGMLLLRADSLSRGYSGVRPEVVELLVGMLNAGVMPVVPEQGSVGASGDLAPLAHLAVVLVGEGEATHGGRRMPGNEALRAAGLKPVTLAAKEGLALINGTQAMTSSAALAIADAERLLDGAQAAAALCLDALKGSVVPFDPRFHAVRPHPGAGQVARNLRRLLQASAIADSHVGCAKVQDPYSIRCAAVVLGASHDALVHVREVVQREMRAVTDNPLCFADAGEILSGGNFHGQPIALVLDYLAIAMAEVASISERRTYLVLDGHLNGLTPFLARTPGLQSGLMMAQYTAAALVSENKVLAHPASVDSIPTSAGMEDHVSMGMTGAVKLRRILDNVRRVLAVELISGAEGLERHRPLTSGAGAEEVVTRVRRHVAPLTDDRVLSGDIESISEAIRRGEFTLASLLNEGTEP
ncbi:MAG TPA: histidine ammonia-lyase [Candidatus Eisenbacteria bacterium]